MRRIRRWILPILVYVILTGIFTKDFFYDSGNKNVLVFDPLPSFSLPQLNNSKLTVSDKEIQGHVALVHFFASWCSPCHLEQPDMVMLARDHGIPIYGIAWHDTPENMKKWLGSDASYYKALGVDTDGDAAVAFGIWGIPETYMVDKRGVIRYRMRGIMGKHEIESRVIPLYNKLTHEP